jgi:hypothetical protein
MRGIGREVHGIACSEILRYSEIVCPLCVLLL